MGTSAQSEFFMTDQALPPGGGGGGPSQSVPALTINALNSGGPSQQGATAAANVATSGGPSQGAGASANVLDSGGPSQSVTSLPTVLDSGGPAQQTDDALLIGDVDGEVQGRAAGGRAFTRPGGLGVAVEGVEAGERPTINVVNSRSISWDGAQQLGGVTQLIPLVDGVIDITDRIAIDATLAAFDTDLKALWSWGPDGALNPRRLIVTEIWIRPTAITGLTSHPIFNLGDNAPAFDSTKLGMDLAAGPGASVGSWKVFRVADNVAAYFEDTTPGALTLRLATPAVATVYAVEVMVRRYHTRAALQDN